MSAHETKKAARPHQPRGDHRRASHSHASRHHPPRPRAPPSFAWLAVGAVLVSIAIIYLSLG